MYNTAGQANWIGIFRRRISVALMNWSNPRLTSRFVIQCTQAADRKSPEECVLIRYFRAEPKESSVESRIVLSSKIIDIILSMEINNGQP